MAAALTTPSPRTWTLRFKNNRTTILLHVEPLQPFPSIRATLLAALQATVPSGMLHGHAIPQDPEAIILGRAVDPHDLSQGWEAIVYDNPGEDGLENYSGKGKGKVTVGQGSSTANSKLGKLKDCPQGAGLRDNAVMAFKFRSEEEYGEDQDGIALPAPEKWDVKIPTTEEAYGNGQEDE